MLVRLASITNTPAGSGPMVLLPLKSPAGLMAAPHAQLTLLPPGLSATPDAKGSARLAPPAAGLHLVPAARQQLFKAPVNTAAAPMAAATQGAAVQGILADGSQVMLHYVAKQAVPNEVDRTRHSYNPPPVRIKHEVGVAEEAVAQHEQQQQQLPSYLPAHDPPQPTRFSHVQSWHPNPQQQQQQQRQQNSNVDLSCLEPGFEADSPENKDPEFQYCNEPLASKAAAVAAVPGLLQDLCPGMYINQGSSPASLATPDQLAPGLPSCTPSSHGSCQETAAVPATALHSSGTATPRVVTDASAGRGVALNLEGPGKAAGQGSAGTPADGVGGRKASGAVTRSRHRLSASSSCAVEDDAGSKPAAVAEAGAAGHEAARGGRTRAAARAAAAAAAAGGGENERQSISSYKQKRHGEAAAAADQDVDDAELGSQPVTVEGLEGIGTQESSADPGTSANNPEQQYQQQLVMTPPTRGRLMPPPQARPGGGGGVGGGVRALIGTGSKQLPIDGTPEVVCAGAGSPFYVGSSSSSGVGQQQVGRMAQGLDTSAASSSQVDASAATAAAAASLAAALAARQQQQPQEVALAGSTAASEEVGVIVHMQDETGAITSYFVSNTAMQAASAAGHSSLEIANLMAQGGCVGRSGAAGVTGESAGALQSRVPAGLGRTTGDQHGAEMGPSLSSPVGMHGTAAEDVVMADAGEQAMDAAAGRQGDGAKWDQGGGGSRDAGGNTPMRSTPVKRKMTPDVSVLSQ